MKYTFDFTFSCLLLFLPQCCLGQAKPSTRTSAEGRAENLARYQKGSAAQSATGSLGISVNYPGENAVTGQPQGVVITSFLTDSMAENAKLEINDWILEVNGAAVGLIRGRYYEPSRFYQRREKQEKSAELLITFLKTNRERSYYYPTVSFAKIIEYEKSARVWPSDYFTTPRPADRSRGEEKDANFARYVIGSGNFSYAKLELGIEVDYSYGDGAKIATIKKGSAAESAGLKVGDMILEVEGAPVGVFGDRVYEIWRQHIYLDGDTREFLVCFVDDSGQLRYYYPRIKLKSRSTSD